MGFNMVIHLLLFASDYWAKAKNRKEVVSELERPMNHAPKTSGRVVLPQWILAVAHYTVRRGSSDRRLQSVPLLIRGELEILTRCLNRFLDCEETKVQVHFYAALGVVKPVHLIKKYLGAGLLHVNRRNFP